MQKKNLENRHGKIQAILPMDYDNYVFDLYGTLVDIHTEEDSPLLWEKLCFFYGFYGAVYEPKEMQAEYQKLIEQKQAELKLQLETDAKYVHEASPEIELTEVFEELFLQKGIKVEKELAVHAGQFFRVLSMEYVRVYEGTHEMLQYLKDAGKNIYLLSNAQRIFTAHELRLVDIEKYFDGILISSDYKTKKPDKRFFDILLEKYPMNPKKTLFIGNDSKTDIAGAKTVDFDTFYVKSNISPQGDFADTADYTVDDFVKWEIF